MPALLLAIGSAARAVAGGATLLLLLPVLFQGCAGPGCSCQLLHAMWQMWMRVKAVASKALVLLLLLRLVTRTTGEPCWSAMDLGVLSEHPGTMVLPPKAGLKGLPPRVAICFFCGGSSKARSVCVRQESCFRVQPRAFGLMQSMEWPGCQAVFLQSKHHQALTTKTQRCCSRGSYTALIRMI